MIKPKIPLNEKERLAALKSYELLDTDSEQTFDSLTKLAAMVCEVPICLISLVDQDRQWFKSKFGLGASETSREVSFCGHAINQTETFYIEDATKDERFINNPLVIGSPNVVFYAGTPLIDDNGHALGTLCVIDNKPRSLSPLQLEQLKLIGDQAIYLIQSRIVLKKKEEAFSLLSKLSENLPGFIYTYQLFPDGSSCFPYSSKLIEEFYEVTSEDLKIDGSKFFSRIHPDDIQNVANSIRKSAKDMTRCSCDYRVILPTLGEKWVRGNANPEKALDGSILWHGFISDISELKKQEDVINHTLKMASLGEMAAGIAHEINNPLTVILGYSKQILSSIDLEIQTNAETSKFSPESFRAKIEKIYRMSLRVSSIVKNLKKISRDDTFDPFVDTSFKEIISIALELNQEKMKTHEIFFSLEGDSEVLLNCQPVSLSQVFLNLINNSIDAIKDMPKAWIRCIIESNENEVIIKMIDSGNGISDDNKEKIFLPFYTTKDVDHGTGLGLSISKGIIKSHSGSFVLDDQHENTCFVIVLPHLKKLAAAI